MAYGCQSRDYEKRAQFSAADAGDSVDVAQQIMEVLDEAWRGPARTEIAEAIKAYEREVLKEVTWQG